MSADGGTARGAEATPTIGPATMEALEAAAYRRLVAHLRDHPAVQNIDLMNLAGFCRNCLSGWLQDAATERGAPLDKAGARRLVYGMPYEEWRARHQTDATPEARATLAARHAHD